MFPYEATFSPYDDVFPNTPLHPDDGLLAIPQDVQEEAAAETMSEIFKFFDLESAALDSDSSGLPGQGARVPSQTSSMTLYSPGPQHVELKVPRISDPSNTMIVAPALLRAPQVQDVVSNNLTFGRSVSCTKDENGR